MRINETEEGEWDTLVGGNLSGLGLERGVMVRGMDTFGEKRVGGSSWAAKSGDVGNFVEPVVASLEFGWPGESEVGGD